MSESKNMATEKTTDKAGETGVAPEREPKPICGIMMPISEMEGYPAAHWAEVRQIIVDTLAPSFQPRLVSDADEVRVIHAEIVTNLATNPIAVCDVSGKNPNVMFELGLRLAFDMPTVVIKDSATQYSFDTQVIQHIPYPRDLRYPGILKFRDELLKKVDATFSISKSEKGYSSFVKHFVNFTPRKLPQEEVEPWAIIKNELTDLKKELRALHETRTSSHRMSAKPETLGRTVTFFGKEKAIAAFADQLLTGSLGKWVHSCTYGGENVTIHLDSEIPFEDYCELYDLVKKHVLL
jgi:hypothetical protein